MAAPVITVAVVQTSGKSIVLTLTSGGNAVTPTAGQMNGFSLLVGQETVDVFAAYRSGALQITLIPSRILLASEAVRVAYDGRIGNVFSSDGTPLPMVTQAFAATNNSTATDVPTIAERDVERIATAVVDELVASGVI